MAGMTARTMVAGGVAGLGLALGGLAVATADDTDAPARSYGQEEGAPAPGNRGPGGRHGGPGEGELAADLAEELGVTEQQVRDAWDAVRDDLRPEAPEGERPDGPPSEADRDAAQAKIAAALAEELDLPAADVEAALEKVRDAAEAVDG